MGPLHEGLSDLFRAIAGGKDVGKRRRRGSRRLRKPRECMRRVAATARHQEGRARRASSPEEMRQATLKARKARVKLRTGYGP